MHLQHPVDVICPDGEDFAKVNLTVMSLNDISALIDFSYALHNSLQVFRVVLDLGYVVQDNAVGVT